MTRDHLVFVLILTILIGIGACIAPLPTDPEDDPQVPGPLGTGLTGSYFDAQGAFVDSRLDSQISFFWPEGTSPLNGVPQDFFSVVWTGELEVPASGEYVFTVFGDDGVRVLIDETSAIPDSAWSLWMAGQSASDRIFTSSPVRLEQGHMYPVRIEFFEGDWGAAVELNWTRPDDVHEVVPTRFLYPGSPVSSPPLGLPFDDTTPPNSPVHPPSPVDPPAPPAPITPPEDVQTRTFTIDSTTDFPNPERGWYVEREGYYTGLYPSYTLVYRYVRLDQYRTSVLPESLLSGLDAELQSVRASGAKVVLRFAYNRGEEPDASLDRVVGHLRQLTPVLTRNADVIAALQAGFIGYWAEWHGTHHDLLTVENRRIVLDTLLDAIPSTRMIQVRYPYRVSDVYPIPPDRITSFDGSPASRVGQLNDCYLSNDHDGGTYRSDDDRSYTEQVTRYTVMGGETCDFRGSWPRHVCSNAVTESARFNWDYLNREYYTGTINTWLTERCYDEVSMRLGYRLGLTQMVYSPTAARGSDAYVSFTIENSGFGKVYNPRPMHLVMIGNGIERPLLLESDARRSLPLGGETRTLSYRVRIPSDVPAGSYRLYLALPDPSPRLAADHRYAIRLANTGMWTHGDSWNGLNDLGTMMTIT